MNYYNEFDPFAAEWLKALIKRGLIPDGEVDTRSIVDVRPDDLRSFKQCHFFAGIGGWSHALRLAGWTDDRPIWTGSCPCQPFSVAGKGKGKEDERHLWPVFFDLIRSVRPPVVMGEQVAGKAGYGWFDGVQSDLEGEDYASRAVDIPACAVNAPHIRQRLYWVARSMGHADAMRELQPQGLVKEQRGWLGDASGGGMADAQCDGRQGQRTVGEPMYSEEGSDGKTNQFINAGARNSGYSAGQREHGGAVSIQAQQPSAECAGGDAFDMADANGGGCGGWSETSQRRAPGRITPERAGFWHNAEWIFGADGKARRLKYGICLLAYGLPNRVGRLRGYGNAIVPPLAAKVIKAFMDTED